MTKKEQRQYEQKWNPAIDCSKLALLTMSRGLWNCRSPLSPLGLQGTSECLHPTPAYDHLLCCYFPEGILWRAVLWPTQDNLTEYLQPSWPRRREWQAPYSHPSAVKGLRDPLAFQNSKENFFFMVLEFELRASHLLKQVCTLTLEPHLQPEKSILKSGQKALKLQHQKMTTAQ
jgi:hypothetical protein